MCTHVHVHTHTRTDAHPQALRPARIILPPTEPTPCAHRRRRTSALARRARMNAVHASIARASARRRRNPSDTARWRHRARRRTVYAAHASHAQRARPHAPPAGGSARPAGGARPAGRRGTPLRPSITSERAGGLRSHGGGAEGSRLVEDSVVGLRTLPTPGTTLGGWTDGPPHNSNEHLNHPVALPTQLQPCLAVCLALLPAHTTRIHARQTRRL